MACVLVSFASFRRLICELGIMNVGRPRVIHTQCESGNLDQHAYTVYLDARPGLRLSFASLRGQMCELDFINVGRLKVLYVLLREW